MNPKLRAAIIFEAGCEEFETFREQLTKACLSSTPPELAVMELTPELVTAEFKIEFLSAGHLVDVLEFFICRDGVFVASVEEIREWVREDVTDVIARQNRRL